MRIWWLKRVWAALVLAPMFGVGTSFAQELKPTEQQVPALNTTEPEPAAPYKLHVYANLVQVPTLVLSKAEKAVPPVAREHFSITLDEGPVFHPTHMRMEGDDPLALGILIDATGSQSKTVAKLADSVSELTSRSLNESDTAIIYSVDCKIIRSHLLPHPSAEFMHTVVDNVLAAPTLHGGKQKPSCGSSVPLWDALAHLVQMLSPLPGRRAVLVISEGNDQGNRMSFDSLCELTSSSGVAIFGLRDAPATAWVLSGNPGPWGRMRTGSSYLSHNAGTDPLEFLTQRNGGLVFRSGARELTDTLEKFVSMLRSRYILEFPRPDQGLPGAHTIDISVAGQPKYLVRVTGVSITAPDASAPGTNNVPAKASPAVFGSKKPSELKTQTPKPKVP